MSVLHRIAEAISPDLGGVDWAVLEARYGKPRDQVVYDTSDPNTVGSGVFSYLPAIEDAYQRATAALASFEFSWLVVDNPETSQDEVVLAMQAWQDVAADVGSMGNVILAAIEHGQQMLMPGQAVQVEAEKLRALVSTTYYTALYGAVAHKHAILQLEEFPGADIVTSADDIVKMFNGLEMLAQKGVLNPLMRQPVPPAASGFGAISPIAIGILAVVWVLGLGFLAWVVVNGFRQQQMNREIRRICERAKETGSESDWARCSSLVGMNVTASEGLGQLSGALKNFGRVVMWLAIGAVGIWTIPKVLDAMQSRSRRPTT